MVLTVGMTKIQLNTSTLAKETYKLVSFTVDEVGGIIAQWVKVG